MTFTDIKNKILFWSPRILAIVLGVFFVVFGEHDDSPGAQLIGVVLVVVSIFFIFRKKKN